MVFRVFLYVKMAIGKKRLQERGLTLVYATDKTFAIGGKRFYFRTGEDEPGNVTITGRDLSGRDDEGYSPLAKTLLEKFDWTKRILEIGSGLGELPQAVVGCGGELDIIDFVDYSTCVNLFNRMEPYVSNTEHLRELAAMRQRAELILDHPRIRHHQMSLEEALTKSSFSGQFDVVVDNFGPQHWDWSVGFQGTAVPPKVAEKYFLRKNGILIGGPLGSDPR